MSEWICLDQMIHIDELKNNNFVKSQALILEDWCIDNKESCFLNRSNRFFIKTALPWSHRFIIQLKERLAHQNIELKTTTTPVVVMSNGQQQVVSDVNIASFKKFEYPDFGCNIDCELEYVTKTANICVESILAMISSSERYHKTKLKTFWIKSVYAQSHSTIYADRIENCYGVACRYAYEW